MYSEANNNNLDLVQIRDFVKRSFFFNKKTKVNIQDLHFIHPKKTHYKKQPELKEKLFIEKNNYLLWGLLIKTNLYKKVIYELWPFIMNYQFIFNEDYIITTMIVRLANNYKYINKFALIHLMHSKSISNDFSINNKFYLSYYFFIYYLYDYFVKNSQQNVKIIINFIYLDINSFVKGTNKFPKLFRSIIRLILNNYFLSFKQKKQFLNDLKELGININKYYSFTNELEYNKIIKFDNSIKNISINNYKKEKKLIIKNYQITIIIYCLEYKYINMTINSILKQEKFNFEIIIIFDSNNENDFIYLKKLTHINENIKIINNGNNKGIMYSYSLGILNAKGDYILLLQPGYILANENILSDIYNFAIKYNLDLLEFNLLINYEDSKNINNLRLYRCIHFKSSKEEKNFKYNKNYKDIEQEEEILMNKLIKTKFFKKVLFIYKLHKYQLSLYNYYDNIIIFLFKKYEIKFMHIDEYGIIRNNNNIENLKLTNIKREINQKIKDAIFYINFLYDNSNKEALYKKYALKEFINLLSIIYNKFMKRNFESIKLIEKFINSSFFSNEDIENLKFLYNSLIN